MIKKKRKVKPKAYDDKDEEGRERTTGDNEDELKELND